MPRSINLDPGPEHEVVDFRIEDDAELREVLERSHEAFVKSLDILAEEIPEITQNKEAIVESGSELIDQFGIKPEMFEDKAKSIIFAGLASTLASEGGDDSFTEAVSRREFIADATFLLAQKHTDHFEELKADLEAEDNPNRLSEQSIREVYDKYTHTELTKELDDEVRNGDLLSDVKESLGISDENEDDFEVKVLSIAGNSETLGMDAPSYDFEGHDYYNPEHEERLGQNLQDREDIARWALELERRAELFKEEIGTEITAPAWVVRIDGKKLLCINMAAAEKILHPEVTDNTEYYNDDDYAREVATLEHEYTHTQGGLHIDGGIDFGIALEERRAEFFSGDMHGYRDVKQFTQDVRIATGFDIVGFMEDSAEKGGSADALYVELANKLGLDRMVEVLMAAPSPYNVEQSNQLRSSVNQYLGGLSGVSDRLFDDAVRSGESEAMEERAEEVAQTVVEVFYDGDVADLDNYTLNRRAGAKVGEVIEKIAKEKVEEIQSFKR